MDRWIGLADDPTAGGSTLEDLTRTAIPAPTIHAPATTAQVDPGLNQLNRDNENIGRRANRAPSSFASAPSLTLENRAYPSLTRKLLRAVLAGRVTASGVAPAAIRSTVETIQSGNLPALVGWLLREGQLDRVTGLVVGELEMNFPIDEEGTLSATLPGLYHRSETYAAAVDPNGDPARTAVPSYVGYGDTYMLRDAKAFTGGALVELGNLAGFSFTFNNGLIDDFRSRFRPGHNIETTVVDGDEHRLWYPARHKLGPQQVTGRVDLSDVDPDRELKRLLTHAEAFVFEVAAGPLGTTPPADDMLRLVCHKQVPTGGGAEPLQREGDQTASYEFTAYLDEATNKDIEATFTGRAALT